MLQDHLSLDWLTATYELGKPLSADLVARGQTNPLGVLRVSTERGEFGVKQYTEPPRDIALKVEDAAYQAKYVTSRAARPKCLGAQTWKK